MAPNDRSEDSHSKYAVSLPQAGFEGPLDLLLHLIQKHELDILDIPVAFITEKYLEYLQVMQLLNLDIASEYLVMAATLVHIKSKSLLPQVPADQVEDVALDEEEQDPREALIRRLLEYQKYKHAAEQLRERGSAGQDSFTRGAPLAEAVDPGLPPLAEIPMFSLVEAFQRVLDNTRIKLTHDVVADRVSLTDRIHQIADRLRETPRLRFEQLFDGVTTREGLVITFLAVLEMSKLRMTRLFQEETFGPILVELADGKDSPFESTQRLDRTAPEPAPTSDASAPPAESAPAENEPELENEPENENEPELENEPENENENEPEPENEPAYEPGEPEPENEPEPQDEPAYEEMSLDDLLGDGLSTPEPELIEAPPASTPPTPAPAAASAGAERGGLDDSSPFCANQASPEPAAGDAVEDAREQPLADDAPAHSAGAAHEQGD